jgi:branched-subunit amino acid aminotransferase/4-amino-4-deoxychorismate lyase
LITVLSNGNFIAENSPCVPIDDRGFLFGQAVFETLLIWNGKTVFWNEHWDRLRSSAQNSLIQLPLEDELKSSLTAIILKHKKISHSERLQVRLIITGGSESAFQKQAPKSNIYIICKDAPLPAKPNVSLKLMRDDRELATRHIKSNNYLISLVAFSEARKENHDDVLFFGSDQIITESTTANFVWIKDGLFFTSELGSLPGTTLLGLDRALKKKSMQLIRSTLKIDGLKSIDYCALTSSVRGFVPISQIDDVYFTNEQAERLVEEAKTLLLEEQKLSFQFSPT